MLASVGRGEVACAIRPAVTVLTTGDELQEPGQPLRPGGIRNSNAHSLAALVERAGALLRAAEIVPDDRDAHDGRRSSARSPASSPSSPAASRSASTTTCARRSPSSASSRSSGASRCGPASRPTSGSTPGRRAGVRAARATRSRRSSPSCCSSARRSGACSAPPTRTRGARRRSSTSATPKPPGRAHLIRCRSSSRDDGWHARPTKDQGSHVLTSMLGADALAIVPTGVGRRRGRRAGRDRAARLGRLPAIPTMGSRWRSSFACSRSFASAPGASGWRSSWPSRRRSPTRSPPPRASRG